MLVLAAADRQNDQESQRIQASTAIGDISVGSRVLWVLVHPYKISTSPYNSILWAEFDILSAHLLKIIFLHFRAIMGKRIPLAYSSDGQVKGML